MSVGVSKNDIITDYGEAVSYDVVDLTSTSFEIKMRNLLPPLLRKMRLAPYKEIPLTTK